MNLQVILLVVAVILLIVLGASLMAKKQKSLPPSLPLVQHEAKTEGSPEQKLSPEEAALLENDEHFSNCRNSNIADDAAGMVCGGTSNNGENPYGEGNRSFQDYLKQGLVDPAMYYNHQNFVQDRLSNKVHWTGSTISFDMHDSYDPIDWQGLRRPVAVPVCNPTQVPDIDYSLYEKNQPAIWTHVNRTDSYSIGK